jgi:hypothetical protein
MFGRLSDLLFSSEHRLVRDYLLMSLVILIIATSAGAYFARNTPGADPMTTATISNAKQAGETRYQVRSVLDPELRSTRVDPSAREGAADTLVTGGIAASLRSTRIDPCTGETKE